MYVGIQSNKPLSEGLPHQMEECNWNGRWSGVVHYLCLNVMLTSLLFMSLSYVLGSFV